MKTLSVIYTRSESPSDLLGIIDLQKANLFANLSDTEKTENGFVTVAHELEMLTRLNNIENHIIAKADDKVIAYVLTMTASSKNDIPILIPMFNIFGKINYKGKLVSDYKYMVVGQTCVGKEHRGQGILDSCYTYYKKELSGKYDFAITEIDTRNQRSMNAHKRIGFQEVTRYRSENNTEWSVVLWDWKN